MIKDPAGMILFDKPQGWTSHDAAEVLRRTMPAGTKVGHCGALDPLATGLLMLLVGPCTRLQARMQGLDKIYSGLIRLGVATDTGDITGKVTQEKPVPPLGVEKIQELLDSHLGRLEMDAPAYSAVKHRGKALYQYARRGIPVPPKPRVSHVYQWKASAYAAPDVEHRLACSSGTYVRSLAESLGKRLGCGATVLTLRRESVADFSVADAVTWEQMKAMPLADLERRLADSLRRLEAFVSASPAR